MDSSRVAKTVSFDDSSFAMERRGPALDVSIRRHSEALLRSGFRSQLLRDFLYFHSLNRRVLTSAGKQKKAKTMLAKYLSSHCRIPTQGQAESAILSFVPLREL